MTSSLRYRPSGYLSARVLAGLFEPVESETPAGGRAVSFEALGSAWLRLGARRRRERVEAGVMRTVEAATAEARADPRLSEGLVLRFGGADWRIAAVDDGRPGRVALSLERAR